MAGLMTMTAGCGLMDESESAPTASPEPIVPFTRDTVAGEIEAVARNGGLPAGDTSTAGLPKGAWHTCVAPWWGEAPTAGAADAFDTAVRKLRQQDWEIVSSHAEQDVTYRTLAKRGWKVYARHYTAQTTGPEQLVSLTAVEDGCELPEDIRGGYEDPA
ncbi:hypothetical protein [Streptomyces sp. NBC_00059]|uniref:hypothetical protein n=1 Tax=Streptomyces sp. NBC_00059 TaxID=2975635 RepID=UPI002254863D|nr:hypothetical protein [Streptomyces sp. NBC_00059]MCX5412892.1 hypothetical protein [Streptomyces sp. NBC_00059]